MHAYLTYAYMSIEDPLGIPVFLMKVEITEERAAGGE